ncbi:MAG: metallophosphoesterase, partial [Anaerolineales bacterium]
MLYPNGHPEWVEVVPQNLELPRLPEEFNGYRIVQISDLHIGTWMTVDKLEETVDLVNPLSPDLIVITGDFVSHHPQRHMAGISRALERLDAKDGILVVLGNHDHWTDAALIRSELIKSGIQVLSNRVFTVSRGKSRLHMAGLDDCYVQKDRLEDVLAQLPSGECAILLVHEPDFIDTSVQTGAFDLQISGHSHGGQILLPYIGALYLPKYGRKYPSGLYQVDGMQLYTNRGLGTA